MAVLLGQRPGAPVHPRGRRVRKHAAPFWIRAFAVVAAAAAVSVAAALASVTGVVRDDLTELGDRTVPQVAATENLAAALSDMDAQLADVLLAGDKPDLAELRTNAQTRYEDDRVRATTALQQVTAVAGADAQRLLGDVLEQFGRYQSFAAQAMALGDRDGSNDDGLPSVDALVLQRKATDVLASILDDVRDLAFANDFDESFADRADTIAAAQVVLVPLGGLLLAALVGLQILLRLRMRRRLNPAVAVATVLAGLLVAGGFLVLGDESGRIGNAEQGAVATMRQAWHARSNSYAANADESRYLLDPLRAGRYEGGFFEKSESVAGVRATTLSDYAEKLNAIITAYQRDSSVLMRGDLGETLEMLDSADERAAATSMLYDYLDYQRSDAAIRDRMASGDLQGAIELCVGTSDRHFDEYIAGLDKLVVLNQDEFNASIADGEKALAGWTGPIPYGAGILVVALLAVGVWPRLNEYR